MAVSEATLNNPIATIKQTTVRKREPIDRELSHCILFFRVNTVNEKRRKKENIKKSKLLV